MRYALRRIDQAFRKYAAAQKWQPDDFALYVKWHEALEISIQLILVVKSFPGAKDFAFWDQVLSHVERDLKDDPDLRLTVHLVIKTFDDVANEGDLAIPSTFERIEDLLPSPTHA
jgi:hypothetical protein